MNFAAIYQGLSKLNFLPLAASLLGPLGYVLAQPGNCRPPTFGGPGSGEFAHDGAIGTQYCSSSLHTALGVGDVQPELVGVIGFAVGLAIAAGIALWKANQEAQAQA